MIQVRLRRQPDRPFYTMYFDDPATGKEVTRSAGTADKGEAERAARDWELELLAFHGTADDGWEWATASFFRERMRSAAPTTRSNIATSLRRYRDLMKPKVVSEVTTDSLSRFQSLVVDSGLE